MNDHHFVLRLAQVQDLPQVLDLVQGLADFEQESDAVTATINDYNLAFANDKIWVNLALVENNIIGFTLCYDTFSTWKGKMFYLEDFYVADNFRSKGIGQGLFDAFIKEAKNRECKLVKWQVLDWNTRAVHFYERNLATIEREWWNGKIIF